MLRKNDTVIVRTGKDRGKTGKIIQVFPELGRAIIEKVNLMKHYQKPTQKNPQGGIVEKEAALDFSKIMLYCSRCGKGVRAGVKQASDGKKKRICKKCGEQVGT